VGTIEFQVVSFANSVARMGVPVFVMVSGAIFLNPNKEVSTKKIWTHTIFRLIVAYLVWAIAYDAGNMWNALFVEHSLSRMVNIWLDAPYHFWFIPMIIGLYTLVPVLRSWLRNAQQKEVQYLLTLYFLVQILRETLRVFFQGETAGYIYDFWRMDVISNYVGYYILGYYLATYELSDKVKKGLYAIAFPCVIAGYWVSDPFMLFTFVPVVALFTFCGEVFGPGKRQLPGAAEALLSGLAKDTLGIYLMHLLLVTKVNEIWMEPLTVNLVWKTIIVTLVSFAGSGIITGILRRIPVVGRYLV
ncbi:MAG: acyltransferase family protein, partial [Acetatifactor sp.]|nr:acyltransferase family protein [Acetatifactor sp.]